jgi:MinD superfamily P-loop ATPase
MVPELVVLSGKGGTGKTSITAAFATLADNVLLCDADVDAADLHLLLAPRVERSNDFYGGCEAKIRLADCTACGKCVEVCHFEAISADYVVDAIACEGCGVCVDFCPVQAIDFPVKRCGEWYVSTTRCGPMVHARLGIAEENSGKLVSLVRRESARLAEELGRSLILTDGPPGIGCPVIAAVGGATAVVLVVEPTVSGLHDLRRVAELAAHFRVPGLVCINKFDLNEKMSEEIAAYADGHRLRLVGRIPFDPVFTRAMLAGKTVLEFAPSSATATALAEVWARIEAAPAMHSLGIKDFTGKNQ